MLPLKCYDLILGEYWLEDFSPLLIDYKLKTLQFLVEGKPVKLQGVTDNTKECKHVNAHKLKGLLKHGDVSHCIQMIVPGAFAVHSVDLEQSQNDSVEKIPNSVAELLTEYGALFAEPLGLPPPRSVDHKIPLIPGAQPVKVRPYRYFPIQKIEIERSS